MSSFAARVHLSAVVLLLTFGAGCKDRPEEAAAPPRARTAAQALEVECAPEGLRPSELAYVGASRATYGEPVTVAARLTDASGKPLVGREVLLRLGDQSQQVVTDAVGLARTQLVPPGPAGVLEVSAHFAGDAEYSASSISAPFQLERAPTLLRLVGPTLLATDVAQPLVARLVRLDDSQPVTGRGITFTAGTFSASAVTDAAGEARVSLPPGAATGTLSVHANFAGDGYFAPSQDVGDVLRYLPTAFTIWGGNTPGLKLGDRVNFWGHSWAKQVLGGDYDAQSDHKGWAPGLAVYGLCQPDARTGGATPALTPGCWSSKTGNSFPPATLPEYIGVIVTTAVAKSQGQLYGNVAAVAVVKVDPTPVYGPVPGKPGFGTLVAVVAAGGSTGLPVPAQPSATQRQPTLVSPGEGYAVTLDVGNASATAALDVVATEHFSGGSTPAEATQALGTLAGNATLSHAFAQTAPVLAPRGASEPETDYLARLAALDGQPLVASGSVRYVDPTGAPTRPLDARSWSRVRVPRLVLGVSAANCAQPCGVITYTLQAANLGLGKSASTTANLRLPDGTERTLELGVLQPGESRSAQVDWELPQVAPRGENETQEAYLERLRAADGVTYSAHATLTWTDAVGGAYGPLSRDVGTTTRLPVLTVSADRPLSVLPGETFTATFHVANFGTAEVRDAQLVVEGAGPIPLMTLASGATVNVPVTLTAPVVAPRAAGEDEVDYLARLRASDRQVLSFPFSLDWAGACPTRYGPLTGSVTTARVLPVVIIALEGPAEAEAGDTLHYVARLENVGSAGAQGLVLTARLPDGSEHPVAVPALARGGAISVPFDFTLPATTPAGTVTTVAQVVWQDGRASAYGPLSAQAETVVRQTNAPPVVDAGPDLTVTLPALAALQGTATDDGRPAPLSTSWVLVSGPEPVLIVDPTQLATAVRFTKEGDYTFRLVGTDSEFTAQDEMVVHVLPREGSGTTLPGGDPVPGEDVINVVREGNALRLDDTTKPFNFIWVAVSSKGTVVKLDTTTGNVLGEYWTAPSNEQKDPSRTTVDKNGNVWATNRSNNSVVHIGLVENGQCQDRNGNGRIDTSTGYGDVRAWGAASSTANNAAIATAADECILHYVKVRSYGTRHVSITEDNDVWVSGTSGRYFDLIDGRTGVIKRQEPSVGYGGYGGLIDRNGVIWSTAPLMRWDTSKPLSGASGVNWKSLPYSSYGVCLAPDNNVWVTEYGPNIRKFSPDGTLLGTYHHGAGGAQGCVVAPNGDVWVAHSLGGNSVGHLKSDGRLVGKVQVGSGPTGVAVDGAGKIWATNHYSLTVSRIDPNQGAVWSGDGVTRVGQVDFTSRNLGGYLYNYSDMTGSTLSGAPESGTWSYVYDSGKAGSTWGKVAWLGEACGDGSLKVSVQSSESATSGFSSPVVVKSGVDFDVPAGRYLKVTVNFQRSSKGESPVLYNLTIATADYVLESSVNGAPHVSAGRDRTVTLPNVGRVTGSACDDALPAGGPLTLTWTQVSGPGTATFATPGKEATDVTFSAPGTYVLRLTASDGSLTGSAETTVTVDPLNLPPEVNALGPASLTLPDAALLSATLSDDGLPAGGGLTGTWSKVSGPGTVTFTDAAALTTQASFSAAGAYVLRFTGFDGHLERTADVAVQVHAPPPVNAAPVVSAGPNLSVALGAQAQLNGSITDDGLPTASVTAAWSKVSGPGTVTFTAPSSATTRASFSVAGTYVLRLTASDGTLTASADVVVGVNTPAPTNTPPLVSAGPNRAVALPGAASLDGNVTDDGLPTGALTITWSKVSGPGTVTFASASSPATTASFSAAGTYVLRLSANDSQFNAWSDVSVVVSSATASNQAPVVTVSPSVAITLPTRTASVSGNATDDGLPTGSTLTYQWSVVSGPAGLVFTAPTQKTTTVSVTTPGAYRLRLTASDSRLTGSADTVLTVNAEPEANQPPSVDPGPNLSVMMPASAVALAGTATDDGRPTGSTLAVTWRKVSGPGTVTFADASNAATTAAFSTSGDYVLELSASDGEWRAYAPKNVRVTPYVENKAPLVAASAPSQAAMPDPVLLSGSVRDDGLPVTGALTLAWTQVSGPGTATFTRPNQASTYVSFSGPGDYVLRFSAHDGDKSASVDVSVRAVQTNRAPSVSAGPSRSLAYPELVAQLSGSVADDGLPEGSTLSLAWSVAGGPGGVTFADATAAQTSATFTYPGSYLLRLTASDGEKSSSSDTVVNVGAPEGPVPAVALSTPADGASLTDVTPIRGTVSGGIWRVEACPGGTGTAVAPGTCTVFASGQGPITDGQLGVFDPTMLPNGAYTVRVVAETSTGVSTATASVVVEGELKLGHFSVTFEDVSVPVVGIPITVTRTYDSRRSNQSLDFGYGWTVDYQNVRLQESRTLGLGWSLQEERSGFFSNWCVRPMSDPVVSVVLPDGKVEKFRAKASPECQFLVPVIDVQIVFEALPGTYSKLEQSGYGTVRLVGNQLLDLGDIEPVDPDQYRLTTKDGTVYDIDQGFGIRQVTDLNGNTLSYTRDGVTHSSGVGVRFNRDSSGRIVNMALPDGSSINYAYDASGDLSEVVDQAGSKSRYGYLQGRYAHYLQDIIDPRGVRVARNEYDAQGRLAAHIDANGARIEYDTNVAGHTQTIRDRLGNATTYLFDANGRVLQETNALGETIKRTYDTYGNELSRQNGEGELWRWEYDANGNKIREINPLGQVTTWRYDNRGEVLSQTDPSGLVTVNNAYNVRTGQLTSMTDSLGQRVDLAYSSTGNLTEMHQPLGLVTRYAYDGRGNKVREVNPGGFETVYTYDDGGRVLTETRSRTDENGVRRTLVTRHVYDAKGRRVSTTDPLGHVVRVEYNAIDKEAARIDALGRRTEMAYDNSGNLVEVRFPDGTTETMAYDAENHVVAKTDRAGRTTRMVYDAAGRLIETRYADGSVTRSTYDKAGREIARTDARGNVTTFAYDDAGRVVSTTNALGQTTTTTYNPNGTKASVRDAAGRVTRFVYDSAGRLIETIHPDATEPDTDNPRSRVAYDALSRKISETDELGRVTAFEYTALNQLAAVVDALGQRTSYAYDEAGNKIAQLDALGRVTRWAYDDAGRQVARILPLGQRETKVYDANGNLIAHVDFNGARTVRGYDASDREVEVRHADGSGVVTTYTPTGAVAARTDAAGTTTYTYDARDRLLAVVHPDGVAIRYAYDAAGNRIQMVTGNQDVAYAYDALNRLSTVTRDGQTTAYTYDAVGNRATVTLPNGTRSEYAYDLRNRLRTLFHRTAAGALLLGLTYTTDASGLRTQVVEQSEGATRTVVYQYDALKRLTSEQVTDSTRSDRSSGWTYDAVGNRLTETRTKDSVTVITAYTYDANDRLEREQGSDGSVVTYQYDANGNVASKTEAAGTSVYSYDGAGRLVGANTPAAGLSYRYDAEGIRQSKTVNGVTTRYVVDPAAQYAQVIEERTGVAAPVLYLVGDDRIARTEAGQTRYLHADGLGSTRLLTDAGGAASDRWWYEAFGETEAQTGTSTNAFLFAGEQRDPNLGFYYLRARYMDPANGRFVSLDPYAGNSADPITLHKYLYANANPVFYTDPSGWFGIGGIVDIGLSMNLQGITRVGTAQGGRIVMRQILFGRPPDSLGVIGELVLDAMVKSVMDVVDMGDVFKNKGAAGTEAHQRLKAHMDDVAKQLRKMNIHGITVHAEPFADDGGEHYGRGRGGSVGIDVLIKYKGQNVIGFDLKIGKGYSREGIRKRRSYFGDVVQVHIDVTPSS